MVFNTKRVKRVATELLDDPYRLLYFTSGSPRGRKSCVKGVPIYSPSATTTLLPSLIVLKILSRRQHGSVVGRVRGLNCRKPFHSPSILHVFSTQITIVHLLSRRVCRLSVPKGITRLNIFQNRFSSLVDTTFPSQGVRLFSAFRNFSRGSVAVRTSNGLSHTGANSFSSASVSSILRIVPSPAHAIVRGK